jgi:hypothetical protein
VPRARYEVLALLDVDGTPTGVFKMTRRCRTLFGVPLILCGHIHADIESAHACQYFDNPDRDEDFTPLFGNIY